MFGSIGMSKFSIREVGMLGAVVATAFMFWKTACLLTGSESPVVVVLSGSMEPAFYRGDLLFVNHNPNRVPEIGEIIVFKIPGREIPIVHRVVSIYYTGNGNDYKILTKGDNNNVDDRGLYNPNEMWVTPSQVAGRILGTAPYFGMPTILLNDYPMFKYAVLGFLGLLVLKDKE